MAGLQINPLILICWVIFIGVWAISAIFTKRTLVSQPFWQRMAYAAPIFVGYLLIALSIRARDAVPILSLHIPPSLAIIVLSCILAVCAVAILMWARATLGTNWSGSVTIKKDHELVTRGPYHFVRHPIYSGVILLFFATMLDIGTIGALAAVIFVAISCWIKLRQEEEVMKQLFGKRYLEYMKRVPALVPGFS